MSAMSALASLCLPTDPASVEAMIGRYIGASFALTQTHVVLDLTKKILEDATAAGADTIAVGCPLCHANLDGRQKQINQKFGTDFNIPIFYFTQLMGFAFGVEPEKLGTHKHLTEVGDFLKERALS